MRSFAYVRAGTVEEAVAELAADPGAAYLAGGTTQVDLMRDEVFRPARLVDITRLPLRGIRRDGEVLIAGALTTMEELAAHEDVTARLPLVREALLRGASPQLRHMATLGGNLLQRTRCRYYRDPSTACNKREPGTGCAALDGHHRMHAVLGTSPHCIATHPSDLAVALLALDASVRVHGPDGERTVRLTEFYRVPGTTPHIENALAHGELITHLEIPLLPPEARSGYLKVRDRASYEFALASVAATLVLEEDGRIRSARLALGGVGTVPWRVPRAEELLRGARPDDDILRAAADAALDGAEGRPDNGFKVELGRRAVVRMLGALAREERA
ncbi:MULTISPECIES: FAD binding domain-containing protein [Streptomyces]|uniref:FAD binding domain-containing protein n=1 Tax=Streptomyces TaxID=1883 RepID=UPI00163BA723|nr:MULTISPECIES: xanthine dehydrogenase family protein subunit M [Streptomyces]MBC2877275.1 xanthine dehydrogenase family protein subunit M [Streptomyces sp. TYQ1024]UBI39540.1 xanthine dehydrogenase family protein subunit M [Streptomyces mobaraensis]UKW32119.1 xanthine dehydrogenase family protein subunit M [Streptomyces sp. TYQ1024]